MHFSDLGLKAELQRAVAEQGYDTPTPIQQQAIPAVLAGHVGKSPDISQPDGRSRGGKNKACPGCPVLPLFVCVTVGLFLQQTADERHLDLDGAFRAIKK